MDKGTFLHKRLCIICCLETGQLIINVQPISLDGSRKVKNSNSKDVVTNYSLLDVYAKRAMYRDQIPNIMTFNFITFATKYKVVNNKLTAQAENTVPRIFPVYSPNNKGPNFPLYCKYHLLRYKPWHTTRENVWGDNTIDKSHETLHTSYNWQNDRLKFEESQLREMSFWITTNKKTFTPRILRDQNIDVNTFSDMQKRGYIINQGTFRATFPKGSIIAYNYRWQWYRKSYLINAIKILLKQSCAVTATSGKAAFSIQGCTIHSMLKLPVGTRGNKDLTGESLVRLQNTLKEINYIIIDEYSMLGQKMFAWVDKRCRQATGLTDELFGRKSIILVGNPGQLPPVANKPLYHSNPSNALQEQGHLAYLMFNTVFKLTLNQRVKGSSLEQSRFRDLLNRLRTGDCTQNDWTLLLTRQLSTVHNICAFKDAVRLYYSNDEVAKYNFEKLSGLNQPIARINARHATEKSKKANADEMSGPEPVVFLAKGAHVMLTMNLWTDVGLCNGATGTVVDFIYAINQHPPDLPIAVIINFDDYSGPSICNNMEQCVPICPLTVISDTLGKVNERQQLPLKLSGAMIIHKSQGLTLTNAWIDMGKNEKTPGISYVAISRVKTLSSCIIESMTFDRLTSLKKSSGLQYRLQEENRLDKLAALLDTNQADSYST